MVAVIFYFVYRTKQHTIGEICERALRNLRVYILLCFARTYIVEVLKFYESL